MRIQNLSCSVPAGDRSSRRTTAPPRPAGTTGQLQPA
uniref:Uncharacterized protein n=1 Tax=Anguilla anguilla TaxID=7936 RepID=A0A0E9UYB7_ANGAN